MAYKAHAGQKRIDGTNYITHPIAVAGVLAEMHMDTGSIMAALLHDVSRAELAGSKMMFWNTYNSRVLPVTAERPEDAALLPEEFLRYYV